MRTVNVAKLKNELSAYLRLVKRGEEVLIRDRDRPVARIVPVEAEDDEAALVAEGILTMPERAFDEARFWSIGAKARPSAKLRAAVAGIVRVEREESDARILGHERGAVPVRSRPGKRSR